MVLCFFKDHSDVCFVTNVFSEHVESQVATVQLEGVLRNQSVSPLLSAYNVFMGGVDRTDQLRRTYGFGRKSKRFWLHIFLVLQLSIMHTYCTNNSSKIHKVRPKNLLEFHLELVYPLL